MFYMYLGKNKIWNICLKTVKATQRGKKTTEKKKFLLDPNDFGFICACVFIRETRPGVA